MPYSPDTTYRIPNWSEGYFQVDEQGCLSSTLSGEPLSNLVAQLQNQGYELPVLVRFNDILRDRVASISQAFTQAISQEHLQTDYTVVYPIKVNQQYSVINALQKSDESLGLEAGSKAELLAVMGVAKDGSPIICNGYKDKDYLRLALIAKAMGHQVYIVIEQPIELNDLIEVSQELNIEPTIGVRIRLATIGKGKWQNTGGERSKFGLTAAELYEAIQTLRSQDALSWLKLLHIHMGSQIAELGFIEQGVKEACQFYVDMCRMGADLEVLDIGGGLGVDYEGSHSQHEFSISYTLDEYANVIVSTVKQAMDRANLPMPNLMSESGRALAAHHAVLITQVSDVESLLSPRPKVNVPDEDADVLLRLKDIQQNVGRGNNEQLYSYAKAAIGDAYLAYANGELSFEGRIEAEKYYYAICQAIENDKAPISDALSEKLHTKLAYKYFCNFSVFQSLPDVWGIEQVFPIVPLQRLKEEPTEYAVIHDLTCDSDGQIGSYACENEFSHTLRVHGVNQDEEYLIGVFMVGAYQEILGDMHNLFGDTHAVNVELNDQGELAIVNVEAGDKAAELLEYVHYDLAKLAFSFKRKLAGVDNSYALLERCLHGLQDYTYLTDR